MQFIILIVAVFSAVLAGAMISDPVIIAVLVAILKLIELIKWR